MMATTEGFSAEFNFSQHEPVRTAVVMTAFDTRFTGNHPRIGYHVTLCTDSMAALSLFRNQPNKFDILVTDHTMPGMTGFDLAYKVLQIRPDFPIILCTGYSSLVDEKAAKQAGIKAFIMKPVTKKELAKSLNKLKVRTFQ